MRQRMHTGCSCQRCSAGKTKSIRAIFHRMLRRKQKQELKKTDDIINVDKSIGYTD
jgi:hypothetical protein